MTSFALATAIFFLVSDRAHAEPKVGDQATYSVTTMTNGKAMSSTKVAQLVQFDADTHRYLERDTHQVPGQPDQVQDTWKGTAELLTDEKIEEILTHCDQTGGELELRWVPAGIFNCCVMPVSADEMQPLTGRIWIARVPFGLAHAELTNNGVGSVVDLQSYQ